MMDMGFGDEFIQQSVSLLIRNFILNRDEYVLQVHDGIVQLHGPFGHICLLPGGLDQLFLPLDFGFRGVFRRWLHILDYFSLRFLQFGEIFVLLLSNCTLQFRQIVALRS